jgi:hypothetical protein
MTTTNEETTPQAETPAPAQTALQMIERLSQGQGLDPEKIVLVQLEKPDMATRCFNQNCGHAFGKHYLTFDDKGSGCSTVNRGPRGGFEGACECRGFVLSPPQPFLR